MATRSVKVMWDYDAFPLWVESGLVGQASSSGLPISAWLRDGLQDWSDRMTVLMWGPKGPADRGRVHLDPARLAALVDEGRLWAGRVRDELDDTWTVVYFDETNRTIVEVSRPVALEEGVALDSN